MDPTQPQVSNICQIPTFVSYCQNQCTHENLIGFYGDTFIFKIFTAEKPNINTELSNEQKMKKRIKKTARWTEEEIIRMY
ncbi:300_t:CDS:2 [Funneliformis caledonium]|uniref:300_t:CDS:1 n=1 Tax=Funneliformis caledonium TaxID=1117310 RepID=A0A9N9DNZ7_9GLOM|nr:300_t:CDS:2 [Funneliformis caledonium]